MIQELQLLQDASNEIKNLREQNRVMAMRLEVFDSMLAVFNGRPPQRSMQTNSNDVLWWIEQYIKTNEPGKPKTHTDGKHKKLRP